MPGNRRLYEHALRRAAEHSERKQWDKALAEFQNALVEFPDDLEVLEKTAEIHERLGHAAEAAQQYQTIAAARSRQGQPDQAVDFWERAIRLDNTLIDSHKDLAFAYASQGKTKLAVRENLALAQPAPTAESTAGSPGLCAGRLCAGAGQLRCAERAGALARGRRRHRAA